ncbi:MAG: M48 family metalloprotease [Actinomycetota bacterium]|nr:M48 family metalloprotease [Actinomycetota bacterium]
MTATRLAKASTLVVLAAGWVVAAWFLWQTSVPGSLRLPHVGVRGEFSAAILRRSARYDGFLRWEWVAATIVELGVLVGLTLLGPRIARAFELGRVGKGVMVGAVTTLALWGVGLPFGFISLWWGRRYGIEKQSYAAWLLSQWPGLLAQVVGLTIVLTILLLLAGRFRERWWLAAGPLFVAIGVLLVFAIPYLETIGTRPMHKTELAAEIRQLARKQGVGGTTVRIEKVSDETTAANAMTTGIGPSTRVFIWDTFLDGRFTPREIKVVAAHELGHVAHRHIAKGIGWSALITIPGFFLVAVATRRRGGMERPEVVPFALLVLAVFGLLVTPFGNAISRRYEAEADWAALRATRDPDSAASMFRKFTVYDLVQPSPPGWSYVWLDNHPTVAQRIALARAWKAR